MIYTIKYRNTDFDYTFKVMMLGEDSEAKTSLAVRYIKGFFMDDLKLTIGVDFYSKTTFFNDNKVKLQLWDFGGEERFRFLLSQYCKGANGAIFLYDITNACSIAHLPDWIQLIRENSGDIPIMLIGSKLHLGDTFREVSREKGISIAEKHNLSAFGEVSSKTGQNVEQVFKVMTSLLFEKYLQINLNVREGLKCLEPLNYVRVKNKHEVSINDYLELRLEDGKTNIYVGGKLFHQCKYILLNMANHDFKSFKFIESIDEAAEKLDRSMERGSNCDISPQTEFWAHCSNLQAWHENNYDTRILHRNLAFPLLKALADEGEKLAKKVFKEQIVLRLETGYPSVVLYLIEQKYLEYLTDEELDIIIRNPEFLRNLPKWFSNSKNIPRWFINRIKAILNNLKCPYCSMKLEGNILERVLNGESIRCDYCYTNII